MKVILTMDVEELGARGDQVEVAAGYARNFLLPRQLAVVSTSGNARIMEEEGKLGDVRDRKAQAEAAKVGSWLEENELFASLKIGREGKAFGAVTSKDIAVLLRKSGLEVDRRRIRLDAPIKRLGVFEIPLAIHAEVDTAIKLYVDREGGSKEGARTEQAAYDAELKVAEEAAKAEAEARAQREQEAEEAARIAIEKAAARKAREEEEARAREEARAGKDHSAEAGEGAEGETNGEAEAPAAEEKAGETG